METTMKDAWEEEKQRLTAAIEREKKLRRDSETRERRLLDDRLAEALHEGDGHGLKVPLARARVQDFALIKCASGRGGEAAERPASRSTARA
jgi:vacuolar-type H+-ATPase subunit H